MIRIEEVEVSGWKAALRGMRNPKNSWGKSDSVYEPCVRIGENDMKLMKTLASAGSEHRKYLRFVHIQMDVVAPMYWWKEFDTYKFAERNSCSTMHKLASRNLSMEDFSTDHMMQSSTECIGETIKWINANRRSLKRWERKEFWWQMIQLLPSSYNQRSTLDFTYETALNILHQRRNHKLDEWHVFCDALMDLPYMKELVEAMDGKVD